jgi:ketosteroid isomerase-like protein
MGNATGDVAEVTMYRTDLFHCKTGRAHRPRGVAARFTALCGDVAESTVPNPHRVKVWFLASIVFAATFCVFAPPASAQDQKNNKKKDGNTSAAMPSLPTSDTQAIDFTVSQMLTGWQVGDVEMLHKYYDDNVVVVSGAWEPPLIGWTAFLNAYQTQRARAKGGRLDRTNTYTKVTGDSAWVTYQWTFTGELDGQSTSFLGHTSLVLQKHASNWLIVLNHTSVVQSAQPENSPAGTPNSQGANQQPRSPGI